MATVTLTPSAEEDICHCWHQLPKRKRSLVGSPENFMAFVKQVLSLDVRSAHRRLQDKGSGLPQSSIPLLDRAGAGLDDGSLDILHVSLLGVQVAYTITSKNVCVISASIRKEPTI